MLLYMFLTDIHYTSFLNILRSVYKRNTMQG